MRRFLIVFVALAMLISANCAWAASNPTETIRRSEIVLADFMAIPAKSIPQHLLAGATAVAVIPEVTKVGFRLEALVELEQRFAKVAMTPLYKDLAQHPEFRATHEILREYIHGLTTIGPISHIPPPPVR